MKVEEYIRSKRECDECGAYDYVFDIKLEDDHITLTLCKKCLLQLLKAIIER